MERDDLDPITGTALTSTGGRTDALGLSWRLQAVQGDLRQVRPNVYGALHKIEDILAALSSDTGGREVPMPEWAKARLRKNRAGERTEVREAARLSVRDEVGSQLCRWTSIGKRVCDAVPEGACLCRDAARAALSPSLGEKEK